MGTFEPNPDFYTAVLWKKLMGQEVLEVTMSSHDESHDMGDILASLHVYAHCSNPGASGHGDDTRDVTLLFVNIDESQAFNIMPALLSSRYGEVGDRREYHITAATAELLHSKLVRLNGKPLLVRDGQLPLGSLLPALVP